MTINPEQNSYTLTSELSWYQDRSRSLTIDKLIKRDLSEQFIPNREQSFNLGYVDDPVWLHIPLEKIGGDGRSNQDSWFLVISYPQLDLFDVYTVSSNGNYSRLTLGDSLPYGNRPYHYHDFIAPIALNDGEKVDIYIRVTTDSSLQVPIKLVNSQQLIASVGTADTIYGIYFGLMALMIFYNLFIYISFRDSGYLYYILYIGSFGLLQGSLTGHNYAYLWPDSPIISALSPPILISLSNFFGLQFCRNFLSLDKVSPALNQILNLLSAFCLLIFALTFFASYTTATQSAMTISLMSILAILGCGLICLRKGYKAAWFFILAWLCLLPGVGIQILATVNLLPVNNFTSHAALIGSSLEVILLSLALANRVSHLHIESQQIAQLARLELQQTNDQLNNTLAKLEKSNHFKDQFLGTISHELRTPMNGVEGSLELIKTSNLSQKQKQYLDTAKQSAHEMTALIDAILNFSEMQAGDISLNQEGFEIRQTLNPLAVEFRRVCLQKGLNFCWSIDRSVPEKINGDREQILMVLKQLIDNAVKFTQKGQVSVNIGTGWDENNRQRRLFFSVIDSGEGIPREQLDTIFNAFQKLDGNNNHSYRGLGIGLAICQQLANIMGGEIEVDSVPGEGTEFIFTLPLDVYEGLTEQYSSEYESNFHQQKTILVAEDNPVNQMVLKGMLQNLNCHIVTANNGEEVYKLLNSQPIDLIMMDCQMPVVDGFEATRTIRNSKAAYSDIPIIAVTANATTGDNARCINAGMNDYVKKPINRDIIEQKVKHWLHHGKLSAL